MALNLINPSLKCALPKQPVAKEGRSANYEPSTWTHKFLQSLGIDHADEEYKKLKAMNLKEEVRAMINDEGDEILTKLELIDDIQRLGLGYIFENDIKKALDRCVSSKQELSPHATALRFGLLRQHGYQVSQDVFRCFMDDNDCFEQRVQNDIKGMLSLHEAAYLGSWKEKIS